MAKKKRKKYTPPKGMRVFKIDCEVYRAEPLFVMDCSFDEMRAYLQHRFGVKVDEGQPDGGYIGTVMTFQRTPWRVLWVRKSSDTPVLLHELFHLVMRICQDKGIPVVAHNPNGTCGDEPGAYLLEFFYRKVLPARRRKTLITG